MCLWSYFIAQIEKVDIITAAMGHALATEGGFCTGSARVIDHQVGLKYLFLPNQSLGSIISDLGLTLLTNSVP